MSPDSFEPKKTKHVPRTSSTKRVAMLLFAGAAILLLVVTIAINNSGNQRQGSEPIKLFEGATGDSDALENMAQRASAPLPPEPEDEFDDVIVDMPPSGEPGVVYHATPAPTVSERRREEQAVRRLAAGSKSQIEGFDAGQRSSSANVGMTGLGVEIAQAEEQLRAALRTEQTNAAAGAVTAGASGIVSSQPSRDPNGWTAKDQFISETGKLPSGYSNHIRIPQISEMEIKAGTIIPCVLISGINSDLPGNSLGQVTEDVYDSATGKNLLIPKGSKVVGTYDNRITYGQSRVLVIWSKLVYPDGSTLMLENLSAADQSGYTGLKGQANRHWNSIISAALIVSLLGAGADIVMDDANDKDSPKSVLAENAARSVAEAMSKIIEREADRAPTIKIRPGGRFLLFVRQDMIFGSAWGR